MIRLMYKKRWFSGHKCHYIKKPFYPKWVKIPKDSHSEFLMNIYYNRSTPIRKKDYWIVKMRLGH